MADIFISYSQTDGAWVGRLVDALKNEGWTVWSDLEIRAGEPFDRAIERTLPLVRCVVAVWSQHATDSDWVRAESAWAKRRKKLVSIRIEDELVLPIEFFHIHSADFSAWDGSRSSQEFRNLVRDVRRIAGPPQPHTDTSRLGPSHQPGAPFSVPRAPESTPEVQSQTEPRSPQGATPAPRKEPDTGRKPEPSPVAQKYRLWLERRDWLLVTILLAIVALGGGLFYADSKNDQDRAKKDETDPAGQWLLANKDSVVRYFRDPRAKICPKPIGLYADDSRVAALDKLCIVYADLRIAEERWPSGWRHLPRILGSFADIYPVEVLGMTIAEPSWLSAHRSDVNADHTCLQNFFGHISKVERLRDQQRPPQEVKDSLEAAEAALTPCPGIVRRAGIDLQPLRAMIALADDQIRERERRSKKGDSVEPETEDK